MPRIYTRFQARHSRGITGTHPYSSSTNSNDDNLIPKLRKRIGKDGIKQFMVDVFNGDIIVGGDTVERKTIIRLIDKNSRFRRLISTKWRQEDPHTHEWIPCTYLSHLFKRALIASDFRFLNLADKMRSPTQSLVFKPPLNHPVTVHSNGAKIVLSAHIGGLKFDCPQNINYTSYTGLKPNNPLSDKSKEFHNAIIRALGQSGTIDAIVTNLQNVHQTFCWDGKTPINGYNKGDIWPYYTLGDGTIINNINNYIKDIKKDYKNIQNNFLPGGNWRKLTTGSKSSPSIWI